MGWKRRKNVKTRGQPGQPQNSSVIRASIDPKKQKLTTNEDVAQRKAQKPKCYRRPKFENPIGSKNLRALPKSPRDLKLWAQLSQPTQLELMPSSAQSSQSFVNKKLNLPGPKVEHGSQACSAEANKLCQIVRNLRSSSTTLKSAQPKPSKLYKDYKSPKFYGTRKTEQGAHSFLEKALQKAYAPRDAKILLGQGLAGRPRLCKTKIWSTMHTPFSSKAP